MDFQGKVIQDLGMTSGVSKAGKEWKKKEWLVETISQYPRKVKLQCFGDRSDQINLEPGHDYIFYVDIESRQYQDRWFTDVNVFRVEELQSQQAPMNQHPGSYQQPAQNFGGGASYGGNGDPFGGQQPFGGGVAESNSDEDLPF